MCFGDGKRRCRVSHILDSSRTGAEGRGMAIEHMLRDSDVVLGCLSARWVGAVKSRYHSILGACDWIKR
jgi:hypothetical protein